MSKHKHQNFKLTSQSVKKFFKKQYPELAIKARISQAYPKSPGLNEINVQETHTGNSQEKKMDEFLEAKRLFDGVQIALKEVKQTNSTFERIIRFTFLEELTTAVICERLCISERNYFRKLDLALNFFAFAYVPWIDLRK